MSPQEYKDERPCHYQGKQGRGKYVNTSEAKTKGYRGELYIDVHNRRAY